MINYIYSIIPSLLKGAIVTLEVFIITLVLSIPLGILVAIISNSKIKTIQYVNKFYIWVMRGTPLLLQLIFIFFGLPTIGITLNRFQAAIIAFTLNYGAYFGEIFRSGIQSIDGGQLEAAKVLNLSPYKTFIYITLPQTIKRVLPSLGNEVMTLIKDTSLIYVVGIGELLRAGKIASNRDASLIPLIIVAVIYLGLIAILTHLFKKLEKRYMYYR